MNLVVLSIVLFSTFTVGAHQDLCSKTRYASPYILKKIKGRYTINLAFYSTNHYLKYGRSYLRELIIYSKNKSIITVFKSIYDKTCLWNYLKRKLVKFHCGYLYIYGGIALIENNLRIALIKLYYKLTGKYLNKLDIKSYFTIEWENRCFPP